jgi:hypothetical protein
MTQSPEFGVRDRLDIMQLHHRYAWALDQRDWSMLERCFTPDGGVDYGDLGGEFQGAAEIAAFCRQALEGLDASQHLIGNTMIELDGDRATATCYFQAQHVFEGAPGGDTYIVAGTYTDVLTRDDDGWRIAHRTLTPSWTQGNPDVFTEAAARLASR